MKRAFLFPGQGAQVVGMGKDIYEKYEEARSIYEKASQIAKMDIAKICFEGPEEELMKTENTHLINIKKRRRNSPNSCWIKFRRIWSTN